MIDLRDTADFAVVCAGSAGVVVASRLAGAGARVVLLYVPDETREFGMPGDTRARSSSGRGMAAGATAWSASAAWTPTRTWRRCSQHRATCHSRSLVRL
jgi:choline dehydrogenase-like flavoprotein